MLFGIISLVLLCKSYSFSNIALSFSESLPRVATEIQINFTTTWNMYPAEELLIKLPFFSRSSFNYSSELALDISLSSLIVSPSTVFSGEWFEGVMANDIFENNVTDKFRIPFADSYVKLVVKASAHSVDSDDVVYPGFLVKGTKIAVKIYKSNGIGAWCGFPSSTAYDNSTNREQPIMLPWGFKLVSNVTDTAYPISTFGGVGQGCVAHNYCNGNGACDYCLERCQCYEGFGGADDVLMVGYSPPRDCSLRTCPAGKSLIIGINSNSTSRQLAECSDRGVCDRATGQCRCFDPYSGSACEQVWCPNDCSGHGQCLSMRQLSYVKNFNSFQTIHYGTEANFTSTAWDWDVIHGCLCDSSWEVGFGKEQWQLGEWFGADCSLRRCPSGDDPFTTIYEENCHKKNQILNLNVSTYDVSSNSPAVGDFGNYCHIDCSNRGVCDYSTGTCSCFDGSWGDNCGQLNTGAGANFDRDYEERLVFDEL